MSNIRTQLNKVIGKSLNAYYQKVKPAIDDIKFKEQYQGRIIDCMVGEVDDNYIETPETDAPVVKLEHSKEGLVKVPSIKGKTILVDADRNETDTPAEGCRLVSVGEDEDNKLIILSKNKNLIDKMVVGDIQQETGNLIPDKTGVISGYIKVKPNTNYTLSEQLTATSNWYAIFEYDKNKQLLNYHYNKRMLTSSKTHYVAFKYHNTDNISGKFQFEEGNIATPIIEQKQHKTEILLNEPLRSLPNGVCDEIVDNQLIRRVGKFILNKESYLNGLMTNLETEDTIVLTFPIYDKKYHNKNIINHRNNMFLDVADRNVKNEYVYSDGWNRNVFVRINKSRLSSLNIEGIRQWLSENPIEILYELEQHIITELPNSITLQGFDDTTMYVENLITPAIQYGYNALIPYKEELLSQQQEVETNALDVENNIIPYLMDMEFNLITMEDNE